MKRTGVQRPFGNPYTARSRLKQRSMSAPSRPPPSGPAPGRPLGGRARAPALSASLGSFGFAGLLLLGTLGPLPLVGAPLSTGTSGYSSFDSGRLSVVFPAALPAVEVTQDANSSVGATLVVENVLELQPGNASHPVVVQVATPTPQVPFSSANSSPVGGDYGLSLQGRIPVLRASVPLWTTPATLPNLTTDPLAPVSGGATLAVSYRFLPGNATTQGLAVSWSIRNWPWLSSNDLLGLEFRFTVTNGTGFDACAATPGINQSTGGGCNGTVLEPGDVLWSSPSLGSLVGATPSGLTAAFDWASTTNVSPVTARPTVASAYYQAPGVARMAVVSPAAGSSNVTTMGRFLVSAPSPLPLPELVRGDLLPYAAAAGLFGALALGSVVLYRRRERRLAEEL